MGVPFFFSWLLSRYPLIQKECLDKNIPFIDYLYLDLNGVIHQCVKEEKTVFKDLVKTKKFHEVWAQIFNYINKILDAACPKKLIFLALDGVAPRAKMNQQRTRRYKSSKSYLELNQALIDCGVLERGDTFNSNSISPGTEFMYELGKALKFFSLKKIEEDARFRDVSWVISGTDVPGEGEHKILDFIRGLLRYPEFDRESSHCIYGADADLIMLGMSLGLQNVCILREVIRSPVRVNNACRRYINLVNFQILYLNILREYMDQEYRPLETEMKFLKYDINRIIDDFILLCFFIGNDFLPRMYCFDIKEGNFEIILEEFKDFLRTTDSYLQDRGKINWPKLIKIVEKLAKFELKFIGDRLNERAHESAKDKDFYPGDDICDDAEEEEGNVEAENLKTFAVDIMEPPKEDPATVSAKPLPKFLEKEKEGFLTKDFNFMEKLMVLCRQDHIEGKKFYYREKLKLEFDNDDHLSKLSELLKKYTEGLQFVLDYYYSGCPDWNWYFPDYYSPLVSDLLTYLQMGIPNLKEFKVEFKNSEPFSPFKQLLLILPPDSASLLPSAYTRVLTDQSSILRSPFDFYPSEFEIDPNGAIYESEYIAVLPFVPDDILEKAYRSVEDKELSPEERSRNKTGKNIQIKFKQSAEPRAYKSFLDEYYDDFSISVEEFEFDIEDLKSRKYILPFRKDERKAGLIYPSLSLIKDKTITIFRQKGNKRKKPFMRMEVRVLGDAKFGEMKDQLMGRKISFNYPDQRDGVIVGLITREGVQTSKPSPFVEDCQRNYPSIKKLWEAIRDGQSDELKKKGIYLLEDNCYCVVEYEEGLFRKYDGKIFFSRRERVVPLALIMLTKYISYYDDISPIYNLKSEFKIGSRALILEGKFAGSLGQVIGNDFPDETVKVEVLSRPLRTSDKYSNVIHESMKEDVFYKIRYVAETLKVLPDVILQLLDSVIILVDTNMKTSRKLGMKFDMGLNIICRKKMLIVPELARSGELYKKMPKNEYYDSLELSQETVKLLNVYKNKHGQIFTALEALVKKGKTHQALKVKNVYPSSKDPNVDLVQAYIWLIKEKTSHLLLYNLSSIVIHREKVQTLQDIVRKGLNSKTIVKLNQQQKGAAPAKQVVHLNPNFLHPEHHSIWVQPFFNFHPDFHCVGDRVVNIRVRSKVNQIPFGRVGTVIGVSYQRIEVIFDEPFIGGTNLGGRCKWLHGALVDFLDVFNLSAWSNTQHIFPRDRKTDLKIWMGYLDYYCPTYRSHVVGNDDQKIEAKKNLKQFEDPFYYEEEDVEIQAEAENPNQVKDKEEEEKVQTSDVAEKVESVDKPLEMTKALSEGVKFSASDIFSNPGIIKGFPNSEISEKINPISVKDLEEAAHLKDEKSEKIETQVESQSAEGRKEVEDPDSDKRLGGEPPVNEEK